MKTDSAVINGSTFLVTDLNGRATRYHDGFYHDDTRHLSAYQLEATSTELEPLESATPRPAERLVHQGSDVVRGSRTLHLTRHQVVTDGLYEQITLDNLTSESRSETLHLSLSTLFDDLFEVRGHTTFRTRDIEVEVGDTRVTFVYDPDDIQQSWQTTVTATVGEIISTETADGRTDATMELTFDLDPHEQATAWLAVETTDVTDDPEAAFDTARNAVTEREQSWYDETTEHTFDGWDNVLEESHRNLLELCLDTEYGPVLAAGVPWFATAFGRDSLIAAYQSLPISTKIAKATCRYLAAHQATEIDEFRDAEPGKIMHEIRRGEATIRDDVPHSPYYGTIDATALFVVLVHETWTWTGDDGFVRDLWDSVVAALDWLQSYGDLDDDGFLEYPTEGGADGSLTHQAWKDSGDGIMHPDGTHPSGPLAVAEVQGYYYDAMVRAAELAEEIRQDRDFAESLVARASDLKTAFDEAYWVDGLDFYAVALDGDNAPVETVTTNPGHCLWSGIIPEERADSVIDRYLEEDMFTGWGLRTVASSHEVYNPQSYHLGSVWPHDNSLVVLGMGRYGRRDAALRVANGLIDTAVSRGNDRLPELFGGFGRAETSVPISYGEACEPQAWAAATPFALLRAIDEIEVPDRLPVSVATK
ncbi:glycogen debranching N-terminal domain-containing protein [Haloferax marisrubri]|uniref:Amylo-alpha-1,6-glucosidase n=1 Tax=Haloferax marisrubri TaxID=1544719 RepID=A0A2P4NM96_9EURY|nr:glycogen debranching N-terminal domain-containing protein [Haloferax marisrubri]POG54254.1 hypothetical protein AUR65_016550 [Haloferax marisrubri]